jgi:hypothetical protein
MKQLIETPEDLLKFLKENWETISDNTYNAILWESLQVYQIRNKTTYEEAEKLILRYVKFVSSQPAHYERPLFLELDIDVE